MFWDLVVNSFVANLCIPLHRETIYYAMLAMDNYPIVLAFVGGLLGALAAMCVHLFIGMVLARANMQREKPEFIRTGKFMNRYGVWVLVIPGIRIAGFLVILMVAAGVRPRRAALAMSIGLVLGYSITAFITKNSTMLLGLIS